MPLHTHSRTTWEKEVEPILTARQKQVYNAIRDLGRANTAEVSDHMEVPLHTVSGRFGELARKGLIIDVAPPGARRSIWEVKGNPQTMKLI